MARFGWKRAIENLANEVQGLLMAAAEADRFGLIQDGQVVGNRFRAEAAHKSSYAAWLARSYNRKGIRREQRS